MATNRRFADNGITRLYPVTHGMLSGAPCAVGKIPGVCVTDADADTDKATVQLDGSFKLAVYADDGSASAVAVGDIIYLTGTTLSKLNTGVRFGYAEEVVASGTTATISVKVGY